MSRGCWWWGGLLGKSYLAAMMDGVGLLLRTRLPVQVKGVGEETGEGVQAKDGDT